AHHLNGGSSVRVVVATDGGQAGVAATREEESREALAVLCGTVRSAQCTVHCDFLRYPDRELASHRDELSQRLESILREYRPDLILVASPIEFHPDHLALATTLCALIQRDDTPFADLATATVAFYEVGQ